VIGGQIENVNENVWTKAVVIITIGRKTTVVLVSVMNNGLMNVTVGIVVGGVVIVLGAIVVSSRNTKSLFKST
jgi:hypothetical protein